MSAFADQNHAPSLTCVRLEIGITKRFILHNKALTKPEKVRWMPVYPPDKDAKVKKVGKSTEISYKKKGKR